MFMGAVIKSRIPEIMIIKYPADQYQGGTGQFGLAGFGRDCRKGCPDDQLIGPCGAVNDYGRTISAIFRLQCAPDMSQIAH